jgi:hypothetical protein
MYVSGYSHLTGKEPLQDHGKEAKGTMVLTQAALNTHPSTNHISRYWIDRMHTEQRQLTCLYVEP